jgi:hypothetical protein
MPLSVYMFKYFIGYVAHVIFTFAIPAQAGIQKLICAVISSIKSIPMIKNEVMKWLLRVCRGNRQPLFGCLFYRTSYLTASGLCRIIVPTVSLQRGIEGFRLGCGRTPLFFAFSHTFRRKPSFPGTEFVKNRHSTVIRQLVWRNHKSAINQPP